MKFSGRKVLLFSLILLLSFGLMACNKSDSATGDASDYPKKPIQVVVPAGAGGDTDRNSRITAKYLSEELGEEVVVSNVNGAGGTVGTKQVLDANPDGYTALAFHNSMIINDILELADYNYSDYELAGVAISDLGNAFIVNADSE